MFASATTNKQVYGLVLAFRSSNISLGRHLKRSLFSSKYVPAISWIAHLKVLPHTAYSSSCFPWGLAFLNSTMTRFPSESRPSRSIDGQTPTWHYLPPEYRFFFDKCPWAIFKPTLQITFKFDISFFRDDEFSIVQIVIFYVQSKNSHRVLKGCM